MKNQLFLFFAGCLICHTSFAQNLSDSLSQLFDEHTQHDSEQSKFGQFLDVNGKYIAPTILISYGLAVHFDDDDKYNFREWSVGNLAYSGTVDDHIRYVPTLIPYISSLWGDPSQNNFGNKTALIAKSYLLNDLIVNNLKNWTKVKRPNDETTRSFPSQHAAMTFVAATFMHHELKNESAWYSVGAYSIATTVAIMRVGRDVHWLPDVLVGAGIGILSTEIVYLTHQYKWDWDHLEHFDILPFRSNRATGVQMSYRF